MKNRTLNYYPVDKTFIELPDTDSLAVRNQLRSDWQFRIYAQMLFRQSQGYDSYFFTLTYSDKYIPKFTYKKRGYYDFLKKDFNYNELSCMCFDREDIRRFVRGVQQDLLRYYNITDIDYIICSEYGKNTQRSHYHGCFIIPKRYTISDPNDSTKKRGGVFTQVELHMLIKKHWSKIIAKHRDGKKWTYTRELLGWVLPSRPNGNAALGKKPLLINSADLTSAAIYVSKYCTKDLAFYGRTDIINVRKQIEKDNDPLEKKRFNAHKPFLKVSQHFGECINDIVLSDTMPEWCKFFVGGNPVQKMVTGLKTPLHTKTTTTIPAYNRRKLFEVRIPVSYTEARSITFKPHDMTVWDYEEDYLIVESKGRKQRTYEYETYKTDFYRECLPELYNHSYYTLFDKLTNFVDNYKDKDLFKNWLFNNFAFINGFTNINDLYARIINFTDWDALAIYSVAYRNRVNPYFAYLDAVDPDKFTDSKCVSVDTAIINERVYNPFNNEISDVKRQIQTEDFNTFYGTKAHYICDAPDTINTTEFEKATLPLFNGGESLDTLCDSAFAFYSSVGDIVRYPIATKLANEEKSCLLFNSFACFSHYDEILLCIENFLRYQSNKSLERIDAKEQIKKRDKDNLCK